MTLADFHHPLVEWAAEIRLLALGQRWRTKRAGSTP
jgi:hypothetical protein